jgi:GAF domain-containing protein
MEFMTDNYFPDISKSQILKLADGFIKTSLNRESALEAMVALLQASVPHYDWVGIYILGNEGVLTLGPYRGNPTSTPRVQIDRGICGAAVRQKKTIIVPDVHADPRYLECTFETKSEIVVPIITGDSVKGEIDVDSNVVNAFSEEDKNLLEEIAAKLGPLFTVEN